MILENKLGITSSADLAKAEERISKAKALELFEKGLLDTFEIGTFAASRKSINTCLTRSATLWGRSAP